MPLPFVDVGKGPLTDFVALVEVISCLDHVCLTPEKTVFSHTQKCFLLRNGDANVLGMQRGEMEFNMELMWKILLSLAHDWGFLFFPQFTKVRTKEVRELR